MKKGLWRGGRGGGGGGGGGGEERLSFGSRDTQVSINFHLIKVLVAGAQLYRHILPLLLAAYTS